MLTRSKRRRMEYSWINKVFIPLWTLFDSQTALQLGYTCPLFASRIHTSLPRQLTNKNITNLLALWKPSHVFCFSETQQMDSNEAGQTDSMSIQCSFHHEYLSKTRSMGSEEIHHKFTMTLTVHENQIKIHRYGIFVNAVLLEGSIMLPFSNPRKDFLGFLDDMSSRIKNQMISSIEQYFF